MDPAPLQELDPTLAAAIATRLAALPQRACAVVVLVDGKSYALLAGTSDGSRALRNADPFHIASCSKAFTALAFGLLVDDGLLSFDEPVRRLVPEWSLGDGWIDAHCNWRDLLTMRTGLGRNGIAEWGIDSRFDRQARVARVRAMPRIAPFRDTFTYANLGYVAAALAIERAGGAALRDLLAARVFAPLMLRDSWCGDAGGRDAPVAPRLVQGDRVLLVDELTSDNSIGSARVHLSARDAARWLCWLCAPDDPVPLLASATQSTLFQAQTIQRTVPPALGAAATGATAYAMGWFATDWQGVPLWRHGGAGRGLRAAMSFAPSRRIGTAVFLTDESDACERIELELLAHLLGDGNGGWRAALAAPAAAGAAATTAGDDPAPLAGTYGNEVSGEVVMVASGTALAITFADAPIFDGTLLPCGNDTFRLHCRHPALARHPHDPEFRFAFDRAAGTVHCDYFGTLRRRA